MTITTTQTLNQKAAKKVAKAPILPKTNAPFTLGQVKSAIPAHLFQHSLLVRAPTLPSELLSLPSFYLTHIYIYLFILILNFTFSGLLYLIFII
jgi:hypothetical protein